MTPDSKGAGSARGDAPFVVLGLICSWDPYPVAALWHLTRQEGLGSRHHLRELADVLRRDTDAASAGAPLPLIPHIPLPNIEFTRASDASVGCNHELSSAARVRLGWVRVGGCRLLPKEPIHYVCPLLTGAHGKGNGDVCTDLHVLPMDVGSHRILALNIQQLMQNWLPISRFGLGHGDYPPWSTCHDIRCADYAVGVPDVVCQA